MGEFNPDETEYLT